MSDKPLTRAIAIFDTYAGLRRVGYTRNGAIDALLTLGCTPAETAEAADTYETPVPKLHHKCGNVLTWGSGAMAVCLEPLGHSGSHHNGQRRWN